MCLLLQIPSRNSLFEMLLWIHFFFNLLIINFTFYFIFVYFSNFRGSKNRGSMDLAHERGPWTRSIFWWTRSIFWWTRSMEGVHVLSGASSERNQGKGLKGPGLKCLRSGKLYSWTWYFELSGKRENSSKITVNNESSNITISVMECIFLFITYNYMRLKCNETAKFWHSSQSFNSKNWFQNNKVEKIPIGNGAWVQSNWLRK